MGRAEQMGLDNERGCSQNVITQMDQIDSARKEAVTVYVCPLWDLQGPLQAYEPVTDPISWSGIRVIPTLLMEKPSASERAHSLSIITQQVQGKDRIRASKAQR